MFTKMIKAIIGDGACAEGRKTTAIAVQLLQSEPRKMTFKINSKDIVTEITSYKGSEKLDTADLTAVVTEKPSLENATWCEDPS